MMKKRILKLVSIVAAFLLGMIFMSYYQATVNRDLTGVMADATLPMIYMKQEGQYLNPMHGYTKAMDMGYMRGAVLPIPKDRNLQLCIDCPEAKVEQIFYEVRSLNTMRLIEDTEKTRYRREGSLLLVDFQLKDLLDFDEEYLLVIRLKLEKEREVFYYTRLLNHPETYLKECLEFVNLIHTALFDKENTVSITQYLEPDSSVDNDTLSYVSIHSRYRQMIWGDMDVKISSPVSTYVTELEETIASVRMEYEVSHINTEGETEQYEVQESYRVRYTKQRMFLLDYARTVNRIFDPKLDIFSQTSLQLGILQDEAEYRKNAEENIVGFVQNRELWCYDLTQNKLSRVFGFRDNTDLPSRHREHEIQILNIDESGSMHFLVYGYMNRGVHEGETGVAVYTYDAVTNSVEERIFIESRKPFRIIRAELGELAYVNGQEKLYLHFQENIYKIDLNTRKPQKLMAGISEEDCMISGDGRFAAWYEGGALYGAKAVRVLDLETGNSRIVRSQEDFYLRALGFMGTDFIYGLARKEDIRQDITGKYIFPMGYVTIQDEHGAVIREFPYEEQGKYVVSISIENNRIALDCVTKSEDGGYEETVPEPITNKEVMPEEKITLGTKNSPVKKREYYFLFSTEAASSKRKFPEPRQVLFEDTRNILLEEQGVDECYYAYAFDGTFVGAYKAVNEAVLQAYDHMGVVVDGQQQYIWQRGKRKTRTEISGIENPQEKKGESSLQAAIEILLSAQRIYTNTGADFAEGYTPYEILKAHMKGRVLDLSDCSVSMILYYVSQGYPVLALEGEMQAELIIGYEPQNIVLLEPLTGKAYKKGMNDSTQMFEELGNLFVVCLPEKEN